MRRGIANLKPLLHGLALSAGIAGGALFQAAWSQRATPTAVPAGSQVAICTNRSGVLAIRGHVLTPQDIPGATLIDCRLISDWRGYSLRGARLWECDLREALLDNANGIVQQYQPPTDLHGCVYDAFTRWPQRFQPRAHGAILDE